MTKRVFGQDFGRQVARILRSGKWRIAELYRWGALEGDDGMSTAEYAIGTIAAAAFAAVLYAVVTTYDCTLSP